MAGFFWNILKQILNLMKSLIFTLVIAGLSFSVVAQNSKPASDTTKAKTTKKSTSTTVKKETQTK